MSKNVAQRSCFLIVVMLPLLATAAGATDHYVSPSGTATWAAATSASTPCRLDTANARAKAGDRVLILSGTYATEVNPTYGGSSAGRITFMGSQANDTAAVVPGIALGGQYGVSGDPNRGDSVSVAWIKDTGELYTAGTYDNVAWRSADFDSLIGVTIRTTTESISINGNADVLWKCSGTAQHLSMTGTDNNYAPIAIYAQHSKLDDCSFVLSVADSTNGVEFRTALDDSINNCVISLVLTPTTFDLQGWNYYNAHHCVMRNSTVNIVNDGGTNVKFALNLRDSSQYNEFLADSIFVTGTSPSSNIMSNSGHVSGTVVGNRYEGCIVKLDKPRTGESAWWYQDGVRSDTMQYCTVIVNGSVPSMLVPAVSSAGWIARHNTFYSTGLSAAALEDPSPASGSRFVSNVMYTEGDPSCIGWSVLEVLGTYAESDSNLYFYSGGVDSTQAISATTCEAPSSYKPTSYWRSPFFVDSAYSASVNTSPDVRPRIGSWAMGTQWPDAFVGAYYSAPCAAGNLDVTGEGVTSEIVEWTEPLHAKGDGATYNLRQASSAINSSADFANATSVATGVAGDAGSRECITVGSLTACSTYYYAVRLANAAMGAGGISNSPHGKTRCSGTSEVSCGGGGSRPQSLRPAPDGGVEALQLDPPAPNPAKGRVSLTYSIPRGRYTGDDLRLGIFDVAGRRLASLASGPAIEGRRTVTWDGIGADGSGARAGTYFARLAIGGDVITRVVVLR